MKAVYIEGPMHGQIMEVSDHLERRVRFPLRTVLSASYNLSPGLNARYEYRLDARSDDRAYYRFEGMYIEDMIQGINTVRGEM